MRALGHGARVGVFPVHISCPANIIYFHSVLCQEIIILTTTPPSLRTSCTRSRRLWRVWATRIPDGLARQELALSGKWAISFSLFCFRPSSRRSLPGGGDISRIYDRRVYYDKWHIIKTLLAF